jgi:hypothetical protein
MRPLEPWHIVLGNLLAFAVITLVQRWSRPLFLGAFGVFIIILPTTFACFAGRLSSEEAAAPLLGAILLAADISGKLPSRSTVREKLGLGRKRGT